MRKIQLRLTAVGSFGRAQDFGFSFLLLQRSELLVIAVPLFRCSAVLFRWDTKPITSGLCEEVRERCYQIC
jgi:hypothetical protein